MPEQSTAAAKAKDNSATEPAGDSSDPAAYVLPITHVHVPATVVDLGFWGALAGAVVLGAVDLPLGVLVGAGVVVARHRSRG